MNVAMIAIVTILGRVMTARTSSTKPDMIPSDSENVARVTHKKARMTFLVCSGSLTKIAKAAKEKHSTAVH